ncbi:hypothetical protein [Acidithiobacillus ferriphilus]|uniref:hypothetical protein n=1 Tax=Acidithiobacillus ferriphilus TaxID=1689834 RepID=UPI002DC024C0|nr:hypothetical protein [Acidithiobacillus ferriphilus]MEB8476752.1 hypothetical protein [Acidithiobacillus ferriphilus]
MGNNAYNIANFAEDNKPKPRKPGDVRHIPRAILEAEDAIRRKVRDVPRSPREVLAHLVKYACQENLAEPVFPRVSTLCESIGISQATCYRSLDSLSIAGYIERLPQQRRRGTGNFLTVRTRLTQRVAAVTGLPYLPDQCQQRDWIAEAPPTRTEHPVALAPTSRVQYSPRFEDPQDPSICESAGSHFDSPLYREEQYQEKNNNTAQTALHPDALQPSASPKPVVPPRKPNCRKGFSFVSAGKTVPEDLLWLLERGVRPETVWTWMKRLRKSGKETLSQIVARFSVKIAAATNPGGYLNWLITSIERGENIRPPRPHLTVAVSTPDPVARLRQIDEMEQARKQHKGRKYSSPGGKIYEVHEENVLCFIGGDPIPKGQISLSRFVEIYSYGALAEIEETPASSSPELEKAMNIIRMVKSGVFGSRGD